MIDMAFLQSYSQPTLALLYQDGKEARHLKTYELRLNVKELGDSPWPDKVVGPRANMLVPTGAGGVLVLGEQSVAYHSCAEFKSCAIPFCVRSLRIRALHRTPALA